MGPICSTCVHSQIHLHYYVQNVFPIGPAVWSHFPGFWIVDPIKSPKMPPWGIVGRIVFSLCPFPDESTDEYRIWCQSILPFGSFHRLKFVMSIPRRIRRRCTKFGANRSSCLTASQDLWICDPLKPPGVLRGELYLAYAHSQTNPPTCTNFGANRCSRLTASQDFWICDPPTPPNAPWGIEGRLGFSRLFNVWPLNPPPPHPKFPLSLEGQFILRIYISIPRWICRCVPNLGPIGPAVWQLPQTFEFVTP